MTVAELTIYTEKVATALRLNTMYRKDLHTYREVSSANI